MLSTVVVQPIITPTDRFGMTLCLAIIFHAIIILGVSFASEDRMTPRYDTMEIILVQQKDPEPVEDTELLAQADLSGGGETTDDVTPASPLQPPFPDQTPDIATTPENPPVEENQSTDREKNNVKNEVKDPVPDETLTARNEQSENAPNEREKQTQTQKQKKLPTASELLKNSFKIAALSSQIKQKLEARAQRPRRTFISASTRAYKYAAYMEAWRAKVERVGNLNYPDEARKRRLSGSLILDVALNPDGSINEITIRKSSGYKVLDDAAIRIVNLASPYAPFPENIRQETDVLHITRTWQFLNNRGFR